MKPSRRRFIFLLFGMLTLGGAAGLTLWALQEGIDYFYSPTDLVEKVKDSNRRVRLGGLVVDGSIKRDGETLIFEVTDGNTSLPVHYIGVIPDLFRSNQGVIADGKLGLDRIFIASNILAKHDENYVPRELMQTLKDQGHWQGTPSTSSSGK